MSEMITTTARSIDTITTEIRFLTQQTMSNIIEIGRRLEEAKELVGHGNWGNYLKNEINYSQSTADRFMKLFREYGDKPNSYTVTNLTPSKAFRLLALPESEREEFAESNDVAHMSNRQLEQAIKDRKVAQEMLAIAQENQEDLRKRISQHEAESASLKKALDKAEKSEAAAKADLQKLRDNPEIPPSLIAKTVDQAKAEAAKEYADKLAAAEADAKEKEEARAAMEAVLVANQKELREIKAHAQLSSQDAASFEVLYNQIVDSFNRMMGYLLKAEASDPVTGKKLRAAAQRMGEKFATYAANVKKD